MRRVIVSMNITLDGQMAGPDRELDWHVRYWDEEMSTYLCEQLGRADALLLGRVTYKTMAAYWPAKAADYSLARQDIVFVEMINSLHKIVFSSTLTSCNWSNSRIVSGNIRTEVCKLKRQAGRDMMVYGSGALVSELMHLGLIDEYILWVYPVVLGQGLPFFTSRQDRLSLELVRSHAFSSGVMLLSYRPVLQP